jgi:hypothetical protein
MSKSKSSRDNIIATVAELLAELKPEHFINKGQSEE